MKLKNESLTMIAGSIGFAVFMLGFYIIVDIAGKAGCIDVAVQ